MAVFSACLLSLSGYREKKKVSYSNSFLIPFPEEKCDYGILFDQGDDRPPVPGSAEMTLLTTPNIHKPTPNKRQPSSYAIQVGLMEYNNQFNFNTGA